MPKPAISVALSVFNGERYLAQAIESVLGQSYGDFEFLILDDGSTDNTRKIIEGYAGQDRRIRPSFRENRGLVASLNELIDLAQSSIIARMDADDVCHPERFERQLRFLEDHPDHGALGCWNNHIDEHGRACSVEGPDHPLDHEGVLAAIEQGQNPISHPTAMYRRDIVRGVGGYHRAFRHCEDFDLWLRLASRTKMANLPERLVYYRRHAGQVSSRHVIAQQLGTIVSRLAWQERKMGRPDPTEGLAELPLIEEMDALFGKAGTGALVRTQLVRGIRSSSAADTDDAISIFRQHLRAGGKRRGLWRTTARLLLSGSIVRGTKLAFALARASLRG